jgi:hypothetical protein
MAATEPVTSSTSMTSKSQGSTEKLVKVEKPDEEKYKKDLSQADKELSAITDKLVSSVETKVVLHYRMHCE